MPKVDLPESREFLRRPDERLMAGRIRQFLAYREWRLQDTVTHERRKQHRIVETYVARTGARLVLESVIDEGDGHAWVDVFFNQDADTLTDILNHIRDRS